MHNSAILHILILLDYSLFLIRINYPKEMWKKITLIPLFYILLHSALFAQYKLYESTFNGGVVTGGYSNGATVPSGSGSFNVNIPAGSTIRRAYLIAGRCGSAPNVTVTLNGAPYTFSAANNITTGFSTLYGGISGVHAIDVTAAINPLTSAYTIAAPVQANTVSDKYPEFYLYIAFDNPLLPAVTSVVYLNTTNLNVNSYAWTLATTATVNNGNPVGFGILGGYAAANSDCEQVIVNGTNLGSFGGQDFNASSQWGCMAGFQYYNNTLTGYNDDNANQAINGTDALSNIQAVIPGSTNSIPVTFQHCGGGSDNHVWAVFLSFSGVILEEKLLNFEAKPQSGNVDLDWATSENADFESFTLQRSFNGLDFESIGEVEAKTQSQNGNSYTWTDKTPRLGINWYRIQTTSQNGLNGLTEVREVEFDAQNIFAATLSPNPLGQGNRLTLALTQDITLDWVIYSLGDGREMLNGKHQSGFQIELPTQKLAAGAYGIRLSSGNQIQLMRFVVE